MCVQFSACKIPNSEKFDITKNKIKYANELQPIIQKNNFKKFVSLLDIQGSLHIISV